MILRNILYGLFLIIIGCKGLPEEPEIAICTPVLNYVEESKIDFESSYVFCVSDINPNDPKKHKKFPFIQFVEEKPFMVSAVDYTVKIKWAEEVKNWGEKNCKE
ncbi:MAG TPA: hypothetical protein VFF49_04800 [Thermodesulfobacteriota bacterium]|nr:hypothetical protein [Thermodesulfobacteriota bacterium]